MDRHPGGGEGCLQGRRTNAMGGAREMSSIAAGRDPRKPGNYARPPRASPTFPICVSGQEFREETDFCRNPVTPQVKTCGGRAFRSGYSHRTTGDKRTYSIPSRDPYHAPSSSFEEDWAISARNNWSADQVGVRFNDSPNAWWQKLKTTITEIEFTINNGEKTEVTQCPLDPCIFQIHQINSGGNKTDPIAYIGIHVDDILLIGKRAHLQEIKGYLNKALWTSGSLTASSTSGAR